MGADAQTCGSAQRGSDAVGVRAADISKRRALARHVKTGLRVAVSVVLLGALAWLCQPADTWQAMRGAHVGSLLGALCVYVASMSIVAWRWQLLLAAQGIRIGLWRLTRYYLIGFFFNNFLPSSIGGDVARIMQVRQDGCPLELGFSSVFVERLTGFLAMALLAVCSMGFLAGVFKDMPMLVGGTVALAVGFVGVALVCFERHAAGVAMGLRARIRWRRVGEPARRVFDAVHAYRARAGTLAAVFMISLAYQAVLGGVTYWVMRATGLDAPFLVVFALMQIASMAGVIPITLETAGVREGLYVLLVGEMMGYDRALTLAAIVLVRVVGIVGSALGGVAFMLGGVRVQENKTGA